MGLEKICEGDFRRKSRSASKIGAMINITEIKLKIIEDIISLDDEDILKNILNQLEIKNKKSGIKGDKLSQHFESISKRYDSTLKKLAE